MNIEERKKEIGSDVWDDTDMIEIEKNVDAIKLDDFVSSENKELEKSKIHITEPTIQNNKNQKKKNDIKVDDKYYNNYDECTCTCFNIGDDCECFCADCYYY